VFLVLTVGVVITTILLIKLEQQEALIDDLITKVSVGSDEVRNLRDMVHKLIEKNP
jgi:hypothetical protein